MSQPHQQPPKRPFVRRSHLAVTDTKCRSQRQRSSGPFCKQLESRQR